ncbi:MAG: ATP-binding protein [Planctomycetota bacterium]
MPSPFPRTSASCGPCVISSARCAPWPSTARTRPRPSRWSRPRCSTTPSSTAEVFRIEVVDPGRGGPGFARTAVEQASQIPDLEEPRGRGLFLIKNYMDELDISYDPKRGTRLVVSKAIAS